MRNPQHANRLNGDLSRFILTVFNIVSRIITYWACCRISSHFGIEIKIRIISGREGHRDSNDHRITHAQIAGNPVALISIKEAGVTIAVETIVKHYALIIARDIT